MDKYDNITANFKYFEFWSGDIIKGKNSIEPPEKYLHNVIDMAEQLQKVRNYIGMPIIITSAYRTKEWNTRVGGSSRSYHLMAQAVDLRCRRLTPCDLGLYVAKLTDLRGFGVNRGFVHCDWRPEVYVFKY